MRINSTSLVALEEAPDGAPLAEFAGVFTPGLGRCDQVMGRSCVRVGEAARTLIPGCK
jgi:hypothetical protein